MGRSPMKYSLSDEALAALQSGDIAALLEHHRTRFGGWTMMADEPDESEEDEDDTQEEDGGADDSESDEEEKPNPRLRELSNENYKRRQANKELKSENDQLRERLKEFEDKDKSELDKATGSLNEITTERDELRDVNKALRVENAFLTDNTHKWANPRTALRLADLNEVEIDDDGNVTGLKEALDALAKSDPYLLRKDAEDEEDEKQPPTGHPTGRGTKGNANRDKLVEKYPALRR